MRYCLYIFLGAFLSAGLYSQDFSDVNPNTYVTSLPEIDKLPEIKVQDLNRKWALAESCAKCHKDIYEECAGEGKARHHFVANRLVSDKMDKENFVPAQRINYFDTNYTFDKSGKNFRITYKVGEDGKANVYYPQMVIGVEPLYQYLIPFKGGRWQTTSMAVENATKEWFDIYGDENRRPHEWGHWTMQGMNWNSNCAYCHTTWLEKNYDVKTHSYDTKWLSMGVTCVQCHNDLNEKCGEAFTKMENKTSKLTPVQHMHVCATCHSRREEITANTFKPGDDFFDHFRPAVPDLRGVYHADGQVLDEDFEFSSFLMSRQYFKDITCLDCHDPHTLKTKLPKDNNQLCMLCHADGTKEAPIINPKEHSHHDDNEGNLCVECHMAKTTYMGRDPRMDHGFVSPDPVLTKATGIPNSCSRCHDKIDKDKPERNLDWIIDNFKKWYGDGTERFKYKRNRSYAIHLALEGSSDLRIKNSLLAAGKREEISLWKSTLASLLAQWVGEEDVFNFLKECLKDKSPLVRDAAVRSLSQHPEGVNIAKTMVNDANRMVRVDSAFIARGDELVRKEKSFDELIEYLDFNVDRPVGALKRAEASVSKGSLTEARFFAKHAMLFEPENAELARQIAIMLVKTGDNAAAYKLLDKSESLRPDQPEFPYSTALLYAENKDFGNAILKLKKALEIDPKFVRAWYNLALAYSQIKDYENSIKAIDKALELEPESSQLTYVKGTILHSMGKTEEAKALIEKAQGRPQQQHPFQK